MQTIYFDCCYFYRFVDNNARPEHISALKVFGHEITDELKVTQ